MANSLAELLRRAATERWSTDSRKAADEARPLRDALAQLAQPDAHLFAEELGAVDPADLYLV